MPGKLHIVGSLPPFFLGFFQIGSPFGSVVTVPKLAPVRHGGRQATQISSDRKAGTLAEIGSAKEKPERPAKVVEAYPVW